MYIMADGLARLLAPILPITADELWRHLPGSREDSVHIALFPSGLEAFRDEALDARWAQLLSVRDEVNRALEGARQSKEIGTSLAARVTLLAGGAIGAALRQYEADLPMLFIVSQVSLQQTDSDAVSVAVSRAEGEKCQRCWRVLPDVSHDADTDGLCSRCIAALAGDLPSAAA
jgi:isoleucyl-tRNA synthetase